MSGWWWPFVRVGSSPRPWGTRWCARGWPPPLRFIPTPVGNTLSMAGSPICSAVHPHARGEHQAAPSFILGLRGSSPRPWGTLAPHDGAELSHRFIPTPVGNTRCQSRRASGAAVHPHARGEHLAVQAADAPDDGSSPRPWGTPPVAHREAAVPRFIPTPVGNTWPPARPRSRRPVHPHARGEHMTMGDRLCTNVGSSPRPWGTLLAVQAESGGWRFIPTPVGNTWCRRRWWQTSSVHPHARGEHLRDPHHQCPATGSSPRPWGTQMWDGAAVCVARFIPTPVGNTSMTNLLPGRVPVHPHARGEHAPSAGAGARDDGSSPRPWGTPGHLVRRAGQQRFIPTPVGNTPAATGRRWSCPVHPHARGEHQLAAGALAHVERFIPTPVGNTLAALRESPPRPVHPHARGEHCALRAMPATDVGSSPRPWGTHGVDGVERGT